MVGVGQALQIANYVLKIGGLIEIELDLLASARG
jgi:hypothetical protein